MTGFRINPPEGEPMNEPLDLTRDYELEADEELMQIRRNEVLFLAALLVVFVSFVVLVVTGSLPGDGL